MIGGFCDKLLYQPNRVNAVETHGNAIDGIGITSKVAKIEAKSGEIREDVLQDHGFCRRELYSLREEESLRGCGGYSGTATV